LTISGELVIGRPTAKPPRWNWCRRPRGAPGTLSTDTLL